jgi:uncharacterized protein YjbI with pentapeptide repeats
MAMNRNLANAIVTILFLNCTACSPALGANVCNGKFSTGGRPTPDEIVHLLADHAEWLARKTELKNNALWIAVNDHDDSKKANLCNANLKNAQLQHAVLNGANLQGANLSGANFRNAQLVAANISGAIARGTSFSHAQLVDANFRNADVADADFSWALIAGSNMEGANVAGARFALFDITLAGRKDNLPKQEAFSNVRNMAEIRLDTSISTISQFVMLREQFRKTTKRDAERALTAALKRAEAAQASWLERSFYFLAFDLTTGFGAAPGRALKILALSMLVFALPYLFALSRSSGAGIWIVWPKERLEPAIGHDTPSRLRQNPRRAMLTAVYFSLLSATSIGWRELSFGNWISRVQPNESTLRATGWIRSISGTQSIVSVYLLAIWALTYFARPFE